MHAFGLFGFCLGLIECRLKADRSVYLRFADEPTEDENKQACEKPDQHPADKKGANHSKVSPSVAWETEQVTTIMHELMHVHAWNNRRGAFFSAYEVDRQQR